MRRLVGNAGSAARAGLGDGITDRSCVERESPEGRKTVAERGTDKLRGWHRQTRLSVWDHDATSMERTRTKQVCAWHPPRRSGSCMCQTPTRPAERKKEGGNAVGTTPRRAVPKPSLHSYYRSSCSGIQGASPRISPEFMSLRPLRARLRLSPIRNRFILSTAGGLDANPGWSYLVAMSGQLTPAQFIVKWSKTALPERAASQEHFIDLCRMLGQPTPAGRSSTT